MRVVVEGLGARRGAGVAVGHALSGTVRPLRLDFMKHRHQLEEDTQRQISNTAQTGINNNVNSARLYSVSTVP